MDTYMKSVYIRLLTHSGDFHYFVRVFKIASVYHCHLKQNNFYFDLLRVFRMASVYHCHLKQHNFYIDLMRIYILIVSCYRLQGLKSFSMTLHILQGFIFFIQYQKLLIIISWAVLV